MWEDTGHEEAPKPINREVELHKRGSSYNHGLTTISWCRHGDKALDASKRKRPSKRCILIGRTVVLVRQIGRKSSLAEILNSDVIQETAKGIPQTQEIPTCVGRKQGSERNKANGSGRELGKTLVNYQNKGEVVTNSKQFLGRSSDQQVQAYQPAPPLSLSLSLSLSL